MRRPNGISAIGPIHVRRRQRIAARCNMHTARRPTLRQRMRSLSGAKGLDAASFEPLKPGCHSLSRSGWESLERVNGNLSEELRVHPNIEYLSADRTRRAVRVARLLACGGCKFQKRDNPQPGPSAQGATTER